MSVTETMNEADRRASVATEGEMSPDTVERLSMAQMLDRSELPTLSEVGKPLTCPTCGGASVYAQRMSMEGRACLHTTAGKGTKVIAWYCGQGVREHEAFDNTLSSDMKRADVEGWNLEVLDAVRGMAKHVVRDVTNVRAIVDGAMAHIGALEAQLAEKSQALLAAQASERKLLAAIEKPKVGHRWDDVKRRGKLSQERIAEIEAKVSAEVKAKAKRKKGRNG